MDLLPADLAARRPVWSALSEFYLDTTLDESGLRAIARALAASPYDLATLREIDLWEVAPVVARNLLSVAGVWTGFQDAWLHDECTRRARRRSLWLRLAMPLGFRGFVRRATAAYWRDLEPMIASDRVLGREGAVP